MASNPINFLYVKEEPVGWVRNLKFECYSNPYEVTLSWSEHDGYDAFFYEGDRKVLEKDIFDAGFLGDNDTLYGYLDELTFEWNTPVNPPSLLCIGKNCDKCNNT